MATHVHEEAKNYARHALAFVNHFVNLNLITATNLNGLTTVAGLIAAANAVTNISEQDANIRRQGIKAITSIKNVGGLTDADIVTVGAAAANARISTLRALFTAIDPTLKATHAGSFAF